MTAGIQFTHSVLNVFYWTCQPSFQGLLAESSALLWLMNLSGLALPHFRSGSCSAVKGSCKVTADKPNIS